MLKILDFSADIDRNPESNGEYTSANLEAGPLPKSFTICSAFMVEAWTTDYAGALMFVLFDVNGNMWGYVDLASFPGYTKYDVRLGPLYFVTQTEVVVFPPPLVTCLPFCGLIGRQGNAGGGRAAAWGGGVQKGEG